MLETIKTALKDATCCAIIDSKERKAYIVKTDHEKRFVIYNNTIISEKINNLINTI